MQDDREGRARHALKVYCLSRWSTEYKTVKDAENELISRLEVDGMPERGERADVERRVSGSPRGWHHVG